MRATVILCLSFCLLSAGTALAGNAADDEARPTFREMELRRGAGASLPGEMRAPEGRSRWNLEALDLPESVRVSWTVEGGDVVVTTVNGDERESVRFVDPAGGEDALHWLFPDRDPAVRHPSGRSVLRIEEHRADGIHRLWIETERIGLGWLHLPARPREVVLQRAFVLRQAPGAPGYVSDALLHRWVDPRAGVVAEVGGPVGEDRVRTSIDTASYTEQVTAGAIGLKIYVDEIDAPIMTEISYGIDRGDGTTISSLTPDAHATAGDLINDPDQFWDFSGNTTGTLQVGTSLPVDLANTCNADTCGYRGGGRLGRRDVDPGGANQVINNQVEQRLDDPGTGQPKIWLRAGSQKEGVEGAFGTGESRFCWDEGYCEDNRNVQCGTTQDCVNAGENGPCIERPEVPLWDFQTQDAQGWFVQNGDAWSSRIFDCEQSLFNQVCGEPGFIDELWAQPCGDHEGRQSIAVINEGTVKIPSGHTLNALLMRNVADFCVYSAGGCSVFFKADEVRTVVYYWEVPYLGSVALIQSEQEVPDTTSFTTVEETNFGFGLYPPLTIQVDGVTDTTLDLSWDPGNDTSRVKDYVVYWDTDSGGGSPYAFNSLTHPGDVSFSGTTATISNLTPGTQYFVTVTTRSDYLDPKSGATTTYESMLYPTQVSGDPDFVYPVEVQDTTTGGLCTPTEEVQNVVADKIGPDVQFCWDPVATPCDGYRILGADTPESDANFVEVGTTGVETCWTGNPTQTYFIVVARGSGGDGPWGHYGR